MSSWYLSYNLKKANTARNKKICEEIFWYNFIMRSIEYFKSYDEARSLINYLWKSPIKPAFINIEYIKNKYNEICAHRNIKPNFGATGELIQQEFEKFKLHINYTCKIYTAPNKRANFVMPKYDLSRRRLLGYKWTTFQNLF